MAHGQTIKILHYRANLDLSKFPLVEEYPLHGTWLRKLVKCTVLVIKKQCVMSVLLLLVCGVTLHVQNSPYVYTRYEVIYKGLQEAKHYMAH